MVKKFKPVVRSTYDLFDDETFHNAEMEASPKGQYVELLTYRRQVYEKQQLQKKLDRYKRRLDFLEGRTKDDE